MHSIPSRAVSSPAPDVSLSLYYPPELPISEKRESLIDAIREHQVLVVIGETGSGKSTQIPKLCLEAGRGQSGIIGCTQPRRIAAITLANRVSEELRSQGPRWVGYKIRFQDRTARSTRIKFMTDGILLAEAQTDRLFRAYDTLIIDEAHERTLNIDFLLGLIKKVLPRRPDLKVIITSATIDPEKFSRAFNDAPIIEVSGRTYPVEVWYRPLDAAGEEDEDVTYIDQAVAAVDALKSRRDNGRRGDILLFMPTESDIRETVQRLEDRRYWNTLVFPLFGRMASGDQQRIFKDTPEEKIVVATNVAETSITIPRIRYVIDTGLARIAQYNARSRTQSLPVAPIAQASADQRKGRCGRVAEGICIRLYAEEDYANRPLYTPPEILRSNLAEVILRMLYLKLGNIQEFPFLDPPSPAAIKDGFAVLKELGAVDDHRKLTPIGRTMARFPLDPRLARMLIEAQHEGAMEELTILAAALSIQDPRERPFEQEVQADQAHALFRDPRSDFVALLKIWNTCWQSRSKAEPHQSSNSNGNSSTPAPEPSEPRLNPPSQSQVRKFCRSHFLSYRRMREWRDIHEEIREILDDLGGFKTSRAPASYEAIHRSVLSGYLSHVAMRKDKNLYTATKGRQAMLFPGSGLFNKGGGWIVSAELVQTSRLFARTAANIEPEWLEALGKHLCRSTYFEPHWEKSRGQVVAYERVTLYGLPIVERRKVSYGRIHPEAARDIFIRSALVEGDIHGRYDFMEHNRLLIQRIEELESKTRRRDLLVDDEALYRFYDDRLPAGIADTRSLHKFLKDQGGHAILSMTEADLLRAEPDFEALERFPDTLAWEDLELPLRYAFHPGEEDDGVTVIVPGHTLSRLSEAPFEWLVPGLLQEKVTFLLKSLPKGIRKQLVPVGDTAQRLLECLPFRQGDLYAQLSRCVQERNRVALSADLWPREGIPDHLRMRFEVVGPDGKLLKAGRDLESLRALALERPKEDPRWEEARRRFEREGIITWDFGEVPERIEIGKDAFGVMRYAYAGLIADGQTASLRLFSDPQEAARVNRSGLQLLYQNALAAELKQWRRAWVFPEKVAPMLFFMGSRQEASRALQEYLLRELFELHDPPRLDYGQFQDKVRQLKGQIGPMARAMIDEVVEVVQERNVTRTRLERFREMAVNNPGVLRRLEVLFKDLGDLVPKDFLSRYRRFAIQQLPRYLRALQIRGERVYVSPEKDRVKAEPLREHLERLEIMRQENEAHPTEEGIRLFDELRWMIEEFKISLFAPEIKTRVRVSIKRLEEKWQEWVSWKAQRA